jgi:hypothetical protein
MKNILLIIILLFSLQSFSYAKLIEFEKCYSAKNILNDNETDLIKPENVKWSEEYYKIFYTHLYHTYDPSKYDKMIKFDGNKTKKLGENLNFTRNYNYHLIGPKEIKKIHNEIKELEKQGFNKVFPTQDLIFSINTSSGIITLTLIATEDMIIAWSHADEWYNLQREKRGEKRWDLDNKKIRNLKYKIDNYSGGIIQGTEIGSSEAQKITINIKSNLVTLINDNRKFDRGSKYYACKPLSGLGKADNYTKYWWAVVLVAAVIFFIYTQTKSEISGNNKKDKKNLLKPFFAFLKKKLAHKNKIIIKEKKIEQKNSFKSENLFIKFLEGKESLAYSFWFMYTAITSINLIIAYILKVSNLLFVAGLFFIFQWCYFIFATIGTWRSATNYKINKESKNEGAGWAIVVYIYLVISILTSIFRTIKSFG